MFLSATRNQQELGIYNINRPGEGGSQKLNTFTYTTCLNSITLLQNRRSTHFTVHPWLSVVLKHMRNRPSFKLRCSVAGDNGCETGAGQTNVFVSPLSHDKCSNRTPSNCQSLQQLYTKQTTSLRFSKAAGSVTRQTVVSKDTPRAT